MGWAVSEYVELMHVIFSSHAVKIDTLIVRGVLFLRLLPTRAALFNKNTQLPCHPIGGSTSRFF